jgi:type I restriction enzyme S subunit
MTTNKVPQIRFKGFNGELEEKKLYEISSTIFDGTHQTPSYTESGIPFFSVENLISKSKNKFISNKDYIEATKTNKPEKNDILITRIGNIGFSQVVTWDYDFSIYVTLAVVKQSNIFNSFYLNYYMQSARYQAEIMSKSLLSAVPCKINMNELRNTNIILPKSLTEQTKIGDYFQQLDKLIEQKEKKYQKLKQFKKAMLDKMFPKNGADTPEIRFKGFSGKWEEKKIGDLIEFIVDNRGKNPKYYCKEGIPVIDNFMIKNHYYPNLNEATRFIDEMLFDNFIRKYIELNDILITLVGNGIGNITLVPKEKSVIIQNTLGLRFINEQIFMFYSLLSKNKEIKHIDRGMAQPSIRQDELLDIDIKIPKSINEQTKIGNYFQKLDNQIDLQQKELDKLKNIKKASLSKMFV